ncbi:cryptochrome/photolyase family protein [Myroides sp.]|uniref:cryptochrome/photolyase family protein n=1 Tax=Myroides sp. TaxID=1874736 RepID=UPI003F2CDE2F
MKHREEIVVFWFRRDLRLCDNVGLYHALQSEYKVLPIFIFDKEVLEQFPNPLDKRLIYIHDAVAGIDNQLKSFSTGVMCFHSTVLEVFSELAKEYDIKAIYANEDYEPKAIKRDQQVGDYLGTYSIPFYLFKDQVIFRGGDILKQDGTPYQVYTPYAKKWREQLTNQHLYDYSVKLTSELFYSINCAIPTLESLGYTHGVSGIIPPYVDLPIISNYDKYRDYPGIDGTSKLGVALRFGTISVRQCVKIALKENAVWLSELIWREFFSQILYLYPQVENHCFKSKYEAVQYRNNEEEFKAWCNGQTGYPIVDAGMRELNETGFMHNRVRMITASFLTKHLLIDWRWGEVYFAQQLLDYDLASNNGNWQWVAGCGCDAAPYFRVFNPTEQVKKFDKDFVYLDKWVPEWRELDYVQPIVEHKFARERVLKAFKQALGADID